MAKENAQAFDTAGLDECEAEEKKHQVRRLLTYSRQALRMGVPIDAIFVKHTAAADVLVGLDRVFQLSREVKMPLGLRIVGPSGSGKRAVTETFQSTLPSSNMFAPGFGCVAIRTSARPTAGQLVASLLRVYKYPFISSREGTIYRRKDQVHDLVQHKGTRLIVIRGAQNLFTQVARRRNEAGEACATDFLCELMDVNQVGIALLGTEALDELEKLSLGLAGRVPARFALTHFNNDVEWLGLLKGFRSACTWFGLSLLEDRSHAKLLHRATGGNLRSLKRLVTEAVLVGAQEGAVELQHLHLQDAFCRVNGKSSLQVNPYV